MEQSQMNQPAQIVEGYIKAGVNKATMPLGRMIFLGICAGIFIACGASASNMGMHTIANASAAKVVAGTIFPVGLIMYLLIGGELFTGDCLMVMGAMNKKYSFASVAKVLTVVFLSNLIGSVLLAFFVFASGQWDYSSGALGAFTIKIAMGKVNTTFFNGFFSGIMCNIFVCGAVLTAYAAKDVSGKIWAAFFPIFAFVISGYEHCVANMYYIPAGIFAKQNPEYVSLAMEKYGYTTEQLASLNWFNFFVQNEIPVTLGNIVGGMFLGVLLYIIHKRDWSK